MLIAAVSTMDTLKGRKKSSMGPLVFFVVKIVSFMQPNYCCPSGLHSIQWHYHREDLQGAPPALGHGWTGEVSCSFYFFLLPYLGFMETQPVWWVFQVPPTMQNHASLLTHLLKIMHVRPIGNLAMVVAAGAHGSLS